MAASAVATMAPLLPVGLAGLDIQEPLHRFDANVHLPTLERGVSSANRIGETIGVLTMKWRLAPDGFEMSPPSPLAPIEISETTSQRYRVMQDGAVTFQDRGRSTIRFFGAGRTYPATTDGQARLLFAGNRHHRRGHRRPGLGGARRAHHQQRSDDAPSAVGADAGWLLIRNLDAGTTRRRSVHMLDLTGPDAPTVLNVVGESEAGVERISVARVGNDIPDASRLRSLCCASRSAHPRHRAGAHRVRRGRYCGSLTNCPACRAPSRSPTRRGEPSAALPPPVSRAPPFRTCATATLSAVTAYGPATNGTGALTGAGGVLTLDTTVDANGASQSFYALRLADPAGRFRAVDPARLQSAARAAKTTVRPNRRRTRRCVWPMRSRPASRTPIARFSAVSSACPADGMELARWWEERERIDGYAERFDVVREYADAGRSAGFFDTAVIRNAEMPVMGIVQEMFYDRQKMAKGEAIRDRMREFVLKYFMRVSHLHQPEPAAEAEAAPASRLERALSWLPQDSEHRVGFGCEQLYYKRRGTGEIGKFVGEERSAVVDLRDIGTVYDWILLKVDVFDFGVSFAPFGSEAPKLQMPLKDPTYLVIGPPFIKNEDNPEPDVLGHYGFGYAFVPYAPDGGGIMAYGPGHFAAAIQSVDFTITSDGEIRVRAAFVVSRPNKIAQVDIDPIDWSFRLADMLTFGVASRVMAPVKTVTDTLPLRVSGANPVSTYIWMANTVTGGMAATRLGHSKTVLEKRMLVQHFLQNYSMLRSSLLVWRTVSDWTDSSTLPEFCRT